MKTVYQSPLTELFEFNPEGALLTTSANKAESMNKVDGSWDDEDD